MEPGLTGTQHVLGGLKKVFSKGQEHLRFRPKAPYFPNLRFSCGLRPKNPTQHAFAVLVISILVDRRSGLVELPKKVKGILLSLLLWECGRLAWMILEVLCLD